MGERFPGYDVMSQAPEWDPVTQAVVQARLGPRPALAFFSPSEEAVARPLMARLLDLEEEPDVSVLEGIDQRLATGQLDGYRKEDMPPAPEMWRRSLVALDEVSRQRCGERFAQLDRDRQLLVLESIRTGGDFGGMSGPEVFAAWLRFGCTELYAHPHIWNEIGFGGPAYPRGYKANSPGVREPWERPDAAPSEDPVPVGARMEQARQRHLAGIADGHGMADGDGMADGAGGARGDHR